MPQPPLATIPQFYFPQTAAPPEDVKTTFMQQISQHFDQQPGATLGQKPFVNMMHQVRSTRAAFMHYMHGLMSMPQCISRVHHA